MFKTLLSTYKKVFKLFPNSFIKKFWAMQFLIAITSIIDLFGLALFIPVLSAVANPKIVSTNHFFVGLKQLSGIETEKYFLLMLFIIAFVFFLFRSLFILFSQHLQNKFVFQLSEYIGEKTYKYYMDLDYQDFHEMDSANIIRELTVSPMHFVRFLVMPLLLITAESLMIIMVILGIASYDFKVFILLICSIFPAAYIFQSLVKKKLNQYGEEQNQETPLLYTNSNRGIYGFVDMKLRNKESILISNYISVLKKLNKINISTTTLSIIPSKLFELVTVGGLLMIFVYAIFWAKNPAIVIPLIAIYAAAGYRIIPSLSKIVPSFMQIEQFSYLFATYDKPLAFNHDVEIIHSPSSKLQFEKEISLKNILFRFKGKTDSLFNNFSFSISKGEIVGIIGKSGSGKTTLVKIITGFLKPGSGSLMVDNIFINDKNIRLWMNQISYVQQAPYLEQGSLASNIAFLETEIDKKRLDDAILMASLSDFVQERNPMEIRIEEGGKNLSGGQKQRICIARALYNKSKLLIFDEATSALDNETEEEVINAIKKLKGTGVTIIIIAHRYSTLAYTDRIIELNKKDNYKETTFKEITHSSNY